MVIARVDSKYKWEQFFVYMSAIHYGCKNVVNFECCVGPTAH